MEAELQVRWVPQKNLPQKKLDSGLLAVHNFWP
jgi:hypothetical protein